MRHYLRGCANIVMARTPLQAIMALQETQTNLLRHSVHVFAESTGLWRKQNTDPLVMRTAPEDAQAVALGTRCVALDTTNEQECPITQRAMRTRRICRTSVRCGAAPPLTS